MIEQHGLKDNKWQQALHDDRQNWAPVYLKDTFVAGLMPTEENDVLSGFFDGYVHKHTAIKELMDKYDIALHRKQLKDLIAIQESIISTYDVVTKSSFELQLTRIYTKEIFKKFQTEVEGMHSCFNTKQVAANGPVITYLVKECATGKGDERITKQYEVLFEATTMDVQCVRSLFKLKGYLCRRALNIQYISTEEIPTQYILPRWCKDLKLRHAQGRPTDDVDSVDQVQQYNHLVRLGIPLVDFGAQYEEQYYDALNKLENLVNKVIC